MSQAANLWERPHNVWAQLVAKRAQAGARATLRGLSPIIGPPAPPAPGANNGAQLIAATLARHGLSSLDEVLVRSRDIQREAVLQEICYMLRRYGRRVDDGKRLTDAQIAVMIRRERTVVIKGARRYADRYGLEQLRRRVPGGRA